MKTSSRKNTDDIYRELYEKSPLSYQSLNSEGCFIDVNPAWLKTFGYSREEVLGRKFSDFMTDSSGKLVPERFPKLKKLGEVHDADFEIVRKDGRIVMVMLHGTSSYDENGDFLHTHCFLVDVTTARRAEHRLLQSEAENRLLTSQLQVLLDSISDRITLLDPELRIVWTNRTVDLDNSSFDSDPAGQHCYSLLRKRGDVCDECPAIRCFEEGKATQFERTSDDGRVTLLRAFPVFDECGKVMNVVEIGQDVTEKVALQKEFIRTGQLAALGELAAGVAHEINNPITGVINYAQLIKNRSDDDSDAGRFADGILREGDRIARIVRQLLFLAKDDRSEFRPFDISEPLSASLSLVGTQFNKLGIDVQLDLAEGLPKVNGHLQQTEQLFLNILNNARYALCQKFPETNSNKRIKVSLEYEKGENGGWLVSRFHDYGTGIPDELLGKVLQPFVTSKPSSEGTGLGLSISNDIVKKHGGSLAIESVEGQFTEVVIRLPEYSEEPPAENHLS